MHKPLNLLSTMPLPETFIREVAMRDVIIDVRQFINTVPVTSAHVQSAIRQLSKQAATVVFTSQQAVTAVAEQCEAALVNWTIYCTAGATHDLVIERFKNSRVSGTANDANRLADLIQGNPSAALVFFCGNKRRDELPVKLATAQIRVDELQVYETLATPVRIDKPYHGILFYSPSGAESFFSANSILSSTILFAIGSTTAASLRQFSTNTIVTGHEPGKRGLAIQAIHYFDN